MARRFITPIGLLARSSNPASGSIGDMYYNSSANKIYAYDGTNWTLAAAQGTQGTTGAQGTQGVQGSNGTQGTQGTLGTQGTQGTTGSAGAQGSTGVQGSQGSQGLQGSVGDDGFIAQPSAPTNTSLLWLDTDEPAVASGVNQIIAGTNITISPTGGTGAVTINSTGGGGGAAGDSDQTILPVQIFS